MQKIKLFFSTFSEKYLSSSKQVQRIILFAAIALVLVVGSFAGYYYFTRYYSNEQPVQEVTIEQAEAAVRDDPTNLATRLQLAETYLIYTRYDDALAQAEQVFASDATLPRAWLIIGIAHASNGTPAEAITPLSNYVDKFKDQEMAGLDKALHSASYFLGDAYLQLGKPEEAILPLEMTVNWSQTDADAMYKLGLAYHGAGRLEEAVGVLTLATKFVPNFTEVYTALVATFEALNEPALVDYANGMVAFSNKEYQTALALLVRSVDAKPDYAPTLAGLGLTYEALEDLQNALVAFNNALVLDPENFTASRGYDRVQALLEQ